MPPRRVIFLAALTVIGGTVAAKYIRPLGKLPGFSPNG